MNTVSKSPPANPRHVPFLQRLEQASKVEVREIPFQNKVHFAHCVEQVVCDFETGRAQEHFFIVALKGDEKLTKLDSAPMKNVSPDYFLQCAEILLRHKEFILARNIFSHLLKHDIRNAFALRGLGRCLIHLGQVQAAKRCFKALGDLHRCDRTELWRALFEVELGNDNDREALQRFRNIKFPDRLSIPDQLSFYTEFGRCLARTEFWDAAVEALQKGLSIEPDSEGLMTSVGAIEFQRGRLEAARAHFIKATQLYPSSPKGYCGLGLIFRSERNPAEAKLNFEKSLDLDSQNFIALSELASLAETRIELASAKVRIERFIEKDPKHCEAAYLKAGLLIREGNLQEAERELNRNLKIHPTHERSTKLKIQLSNLRGMPC